MCEACKAGVNEKCVVEAAPDPSGVLSAFFSGRLAFVLAGARSRRKRREQVVHPEKLEKFYARRVDERRICFDLIDGHRD